MQTKKPAKCTTNDCKNTPFADGDKCALHCIKSDYASDLNSGLLEAFYKALKEHIDNIRNPKQSPEQLKQTKALLGNDLDSRLAIMASIPVPKVKVSEPFGGREKIQDSKILVLYGILFPEQKPGLAVEYLFQDHLKEPHGYEAICFIKCKFNTSYLNLDLPVGFNNCLFNNDWSHSKFTLLTERQNAFYHDCAFEENLIISSNIDKHLFSGEVSIQKKLAVKHAKFSARTIWNKLPIKSLEIEHSTFEDKFELKEADLDKLVIKDTNFHHVVDFYKSVFTNIRIEKCIFNDFAAFEKCVFGAETANDNPVALFKYVTFKDFLNFRGVEFSSGLSLQNINYTTQPNFLNASFSKKAQQATDRETFRIIKYSFDAVGNHIEANKYFAYEMEAYRKELKAGKGNFKERFLLLFNGLISNHGQDYLKASAWWLVLVSYIGFILAINNGRFPWVQSLLTSVYSKVPDTWFQVVECLNILALGFLPLSMVYKNNESLAAFLLLASLLLAGVTWHLLVAVRRHSKR